MHIAHLGLLALALLGSPSFADATTAGADMKQPDKIVVSTHDLDLSTDVGIRAARARVRRAAENVCGDYPRVGMLPPVAVGRCRMIAARNADARIATLASRARGDGVVLAGTDNRTR
jgi:UrcA family protein